MQYIGYKFAKDNNVVGLVIYQWLQGVPHLNIHTKGKIIRDWRIGAFLLNIGDPTPGSSDTKMIEQWTKHQANTDYHKDQYLKKYVERNLFKL